MRKTYQMQNETLLSGSMAVLFFVSLLISSCSADGEQWTGQAEPRTKEPDLSKQEPDLSKQTTSQLIEKLVNLSVTDSAYYTLRSHVLVTLREVNFSSTYVLRDDDSVPPVILELVRRGVLALPELLKHLSDARPTKFVVGPFKWRVGPGHVILLDDWYDSRYRNPARQPTGVNRENLRLLDSYTASVGDLCYLIVDQIVNRLPKRASIFRLFSSPVETPALAAALRQDWSGLTAEQHQQSLKQDALRKSLFLNIRSYLSTQRLCFYYPKVGETFVVKLLARRLYSERKVKEFVNKRLLQTGDVAKWRQLIETFQHSEGPAAAEAIPFVLCEIADYEEDEALGETSKEIMQRLYPQFDCYNPPFVNAASLEEQDSLVCGLQWFQSEQIDKSAYQLFQNSSERLQAGEAEDRLSKYMLDAMAISCIERLADKGHNEEFRSFCRRRLKQFTPAERERDKRRNMPRPEAYQKLLTRLVGDK